MGDLVGWVAGDAGEVARGIVGLPGGEEGGGGGGLEGGFEVEEELEVGGTGGVGGGEEGEERE